MNPQIISNGKLIGMSFILKQNEKVVFVAEVSILPEYQGKGLGKALMNKIIQSCANKGYSKLGIDVTKDNISAYKLYQKLDFIEQNEFLTIIKHR